MGNEEVLHYIFKRISTAWIVLAITLTATLWGSLLINHIEQQQTQQNVFDYRVERIKLIIKNRFQAYQQILQSGAGLFAASEQVGHKEWKYFVDHLELKEHYSGIQGVGFTKLILPEEKDKHIQEVRQYNSSFLNYNIRPEGQREQYTSIIYLEPLDERNQAAIGYDMFSEPVRRIAMERARDTDNIALSGKVSLVQEIDEHKQAGFLLYLPVYKKGVSLETVEERRASLLGYIYSPFRMDDFMRGLFGEKPSGIDIHIYDGDLEGTPNQSQLLYDEMSDNVYDSQFNTKEKITFAGHTWTLYFYSLPEFETSNRTYASKIVLVGGLAVSFLLFGFTRSFETARLLEAEHKLTLKLKQEIAERKKIETELNELNRDFVTLLNNTSDFIYFKDKDSRIHFCSQRMAAITGHQHWEEMRGKHDFEIFPKDTAQVYYEEEQPIFKGEKRAIDTINPFYDEDGNEGWVHTNKWAVLGENNEIIGIFGISRDITERKRIEIELSNAKQLSDNIINSLPGIFYMLDKEGKFIRWNANFYKTVGYDSPNILGHSALKVIADHDKELVSKKIAEVFEKGESFVEAGLLDKNGRITPYYFTGKQIYLQEQLCLIGLGLDISDRKQLEEDLWRLANTDFLTGLKNRRYFMEKIEEEFKLLKNHEINSCSVLMLDLDHFKRINDTYGHGIGDTVLKHFSALLQSNLRQMDVAGRLGGEEFAVILPCADIEEAIKCAEHLRNVVEHSPIVENNNVISITVSIGISIFKENDCFADTALIRADNALFAAKNRGRNTIQIAA